MADAYYVELLDADTGEWSRALRRAQPVYSQWPIAAENIGRKLAEKTGQKHRIITGSGLVVYPRPRTKK